MKLSKTKRIFLYFALIIGIVSILINDIGYALAYIDVVGFGLNTFIGFVLAYESVSTLRRKIKHSIAGEILLWTVCIASLLSLISLVQKPSFFTAVSFTVKTLLAFVLFDQKQTYRKLTIKK